MFSGGVGGDGGGGTTAELVSSSSTSTPPTTINAVDDGDSEGRLKGDGDSNWPRTKYDSLLV